MKQIMKILHRLDAFQQKHPILAFPIAVFKKYGDDNAGDQAALITYYGFLSLFPLLFVLLSIAGVIAKTNSNLADKIVHAAFAFFPVVGAQLQSNIHGAKQSGLGLIIVILIALFGASGVASTLQQVINNLWQVDKKARRKYPLNILRSFEIIILGGGGFILTSLFIAFVAHQTSMWAKVLILPISLSLNFLVFLAIYRLSVIKQIKTKHLLLGSLITAIAWQILQAIGSYLVLNRLNRMSALYGIFAIVLGILFWIFFEAQIMLYAVEVDVVRTKKLWPRSLF